MSFEDPYLIPTVPQFKRDLTEDLDDTIGDEFFDKLFINSPRSTTDKSPPPKPKALPAAPVELKKTTGRTVRRSLMKPGLPLLGVKEQNEVKKTVEKVPKNDVPPPAPPAPANNMLLTANAPVTRSRSVYIQNAEKAANATSNAIVVHEPTAPPVLNRLKNTQSIYTSKIPPPAKTTRRSLMKPGRPSVSSALDNNKENKADAGVSSSTITTPQKKSPMKPRTRLQIAQAQAAKQETTSALQPSASAASQSRFTSKLKQSTVAATTATPNVTSSSKNKRRSFMDPTISSASKLIYGTPSKN